MKQFFNNDAARCIAKFFFLVIYRILSAFAERSGVDKNRGRMKTAHNQASRFQAHPAARAASCMCCTRKYSICHDRFRTLFKRTRQPGIAKFYLRHHDIVIRPQVGCFQSHGNLLGICDRRCYEAGHLKHTLKNSYLTVKRRRRLLHRNIRAVKERSID